MANLGAQNVFDVDPIVGIGRMAVRRLPKGYMEFFCGQSTQIAKRMVCTAIIMEAGERHLDAGSTGLWDVDIDELVLKMNHTL